MKKSRIILLIVSFMAFSVLQAQRHELVKLWETDSLLKVPESVLLDAKNSVLYVSNIDGAPDGKDGKGSIGKVGIDGKIIVVDWVSGLNAPKGMGIHKNILYVADLDVVAVIDMKKGVILQRIPVEGALFLNDISLDKNGIVYVSDTRSKKVYRIQNGVASLYIDSLQRPNGVLVHNGKLLVLDNGSLLRKDDSGLTKLAEGMEPDTDGIENVQGKDFIVSCWSGVIYYVKEDGSKEKLLDSRDKKSNTADIGYDAKKRIVYVPTFLKNSVVAYELK